MQALDRIHPPTAIFAGADIAALGVLRAVEERGLRVPDDLTVVGYDNIYTSTINRISLTTVDQSGYLTGEACVRLLLERIDGRTEPEQFVVVPDLMIRGTSGPPPPRLRARRRRLRLIRYPVWRAPSRRQPKAVVHCLHIRRAGFETNGEDRIWHLEGEPAGQGGLAGDRQGGRRQRALAGHKIVRPEPGPRTFLTARFLYRVAPEFQLRVSGPRSSRRRRRTVCARCR